MHLKHLNLIVVMLFVLCQNSYGQSSTEIRTFNPSPKGIYRVLTLTPHSFSGPCDLGSLAVSTSNELFMCTAGTWDSFGMFYWKRIVTNGIGKISPKNSGDYVGIGTSTPRVKLEVIDKDKPAALLVGGKGTAFVNSCIALADENGTWDPANGTSLTGWNMCYTNAPASYPTWDELLVFQKWTGTEHRNVMLLGKDGNVGIGVDHPPMARLEVQSTDAPAGLVISGKGDQFNRSCMALTDEKGINGADTKGWNMCYTVGKNAAGVVDNNYADQFVIQRWDKAMYPTNSHRNVFFLTKDGKLGLNTDRVPLVNLEILDPVKPAGLLIGGKGGQYTNSCIALTDENGVWDPAKGITANGWNMCYSNAPATAPSWDEMLIFQKWSGVNHVDAMVIDKVGNVGISPAGGLPTAKFEVGSNTYIQAKFKSSSSSGGIKLSPDVGNEWEIQAVPSDSNPANSLIFYNRTDSAYRFVVTDTGNVGVGTINPQAKLDVFGGAKFSGSINVADANVATGKMVCVKANGNLGTCAAGHFIYSSVTNTASCTQCDEL